MKDYLLNRRFTDRVGEAHYEFHRRIWETTEGIYCPVCERSGKMSKCPISKPMANCLIWLYRNTTEYRPVHFNEKAPRVLVKAACVGKLKHWGLVEQLRNPADPAKLKSGYVRITPAGREFVEGAKVTKYRYLYNNQCYGEPDDNPLITISDALKEPFDIRDILKPALT